MNAAILFVTTEPIGVNNSTGYIIGAIIALLIFGYLFYALIKPEKL